MRRYFEMLLLCLCSYCFPLLSQEIDEEDYALAVAKALTCSIFGNISNSTDIDQFEPNLSAECEPLAAVAECVNVISGHFFQIEKDLKGNTIEPLDFIRYYDSGDVAESFLGYGFGSGFPLWASAIQKGARHHYGMISERENFLVLYRDKEAGPSKICYVDPRILEKGYTNLCRATISGHANFVNWQATFSHDKWRVQLGDGTKRVYDKAVDFEKDHQSRMNFPTKSAYLLTKEIKPNGNQLLFSYKTMHGKPRLTQVQTLNRTGKATLNSLTFQYTGEGCTISDPYGNKVDYFQKEEPRLYSTSLGVRWIQKNFLTEMTSTQKGKHQFKPAEMTWKIKKIEKPGDQFIRVEYHSNGKVKALYAPQEKRSNAMHLIIITIIQMSSMRLIN